MSYYYDPDYYAKEMAKAVEKHLSDLGASIKERLKELDDRIKKLEQSK